MAVAASGERQPPKNSRLAAERPMAALAGHAGVRPAGEARPVVEARRQIAPWEDHVPALFRVATGAVRAEGTLVGILVAALAAAVGDRLHLHEGRTAWRREDLLERSPILDGGVATGAGDRGVLAAQREGGLLVIERAQRRLPEESRVAVALLTVLAELPPVLVEMAAVAAPGQPEEGGAPRLRRQHPDDRLVDQLVTDVAAAARGLRVVAAQGPTGPLVIESFDAPAEADQREVEPAMIGMAILALVQDRRDHPTVQAVVLLDLGSELGVAGEAAVGEAGLTLVVAPAALAETLVVEGGVRLGERPGRKELGACVVSAAHQQQESHPDRAPADQSRSPHAFPTGRLTTRAT